MEFGDGMLKAKALDDRIGCAVMLELLREPLPMDCTFAFTAQEEVGCRGAFGAAFSENGVLYVTASKGGVSLSDFEELLASISYRP